MVPFSYARLSGIFRVFDVDVALCGYAVVTRGAEGGAGSVTSMKTRLNESLRM